MWEVSLAGKGFTEHTSFEPWIEDSKSNGSEIVDKKAKWHLENDARVKVTDWENEADVMEKQFIPKAQQHEWFVICNLGMVNDRDMVRTDEQWVSTEEGWTEIRLYRYLCRVPPTVDLQGALKL